MPAKSRLTADPRFVDVVCVDDDWVDAEFDAIIAANFPQGAIPTPPRRGRCGRVPFRRPPRRHHRPEPRLIPLAEGLALRQALAWPRGPP